MELNNVEDEKKFKKEASDIQFEKYKKELSDIEFERQCRKEIYENENDEIPNKKFKDAVEAPENASLEPKSSIPSFSEIGKLESDVSLDEDFDEDFEDEIYDDEFSAQYMELD